MWISYSRHDHTRGTILLELDVCAAEDRLLELNGQIDNGRGNIAVLDNTPHERAELVTKLSLHEVRHLLI